jgi:hypothetical protein
LIPFQLLLTANKVYSCQGNKRIRNIGSRSSGKPKHRVRPQQRGQAFDVAGFLAP